MIGDINPHLSKANLSTHHNNNYDDKSEASRYNPCDFFSSQNPVVVAILVTEIFILIIAGCNLCWKKANIYE